MDTADAIFGEGAERTIVQLMVQVHTRIMRQCILIEAHFETIIKESKCSIDNKMSRPMTLLNRGNLGNLGLLPNYIVNS